MNFAELMMKYSRIPVIILTAYYDRRALLKYKIHLSYITDFSDPLTAF